MGQDLDERGGYRVSVHLRDDARLLLPEWRALLTANPARNPLCDPDQQLVWCAQFVAPGDERILAVRHVESGRLVGVVPLFLHEALHGWQAGRSFHVFGALYEPFLHEVPEVCVDAAHARQALAAVVGWLYRKERWDWVDLDLRDDQPWPEPRWITDVGERSAILHRDPLPYVTLPLSAERTFPTVGRNLREALRRFRNRLARQAGAWRFDLVRPGDQGWNAAVDDLVRLHTERSEMAGRPRHKNLFAGTRQERYLRSLSPGTAAGPVINLLRRDEHARAALLTLESPTSTVISASGFGADVWELNAVTGLQQHAIQRAVDDGRRAVYFSPGIDTAKLRWGSGRRVTHRFSLVHPRRSSVLVYQLASIVRRHHNLRVQLNHFASTADKARRAVPSAHPVLPGTLRDSLRQLVRTR